MFPMRGLWIVAVVAALMISRAEWVIAAEDLADLVQASLKDGEAERLRNHVRTDQKGNSAPGDPPSPEEWDEDRIAAFQHALVARSIARVRAYSEQMGVNWNRAVIEKMAEQEMGFRIRCDGIVVSVFVPLFGAGSKDMRLSTPWVATVMTPEEQAEVRQWIPGLDAKADKRIAQILIRSRAMFELLNRYQLYGINGPSLPSFTCVLPPAFERTERDKLEIKPEGFEGGTFVETGANTFEFVGSYVVSGIDVPLSLKIDAKIGADAVGQKSWRAQLNGESVQFRRVDGSSERTFRSPRYETRVLGSAGPRDRHVLITMEDGMVISAEIAGMVLRHPSIENGERS